MITNIATDKLSLSLWDYTDGYIVSDIEGLGPVNAEFTSSDYALHDGSRFQWARRGTRNIVITVDLVVGHPTKTVSQLRSDIYRAFLPKMPVTITVSRSDGPDLYIDCHVESTEPVIFSQEPKVTISLVAFDPDFRRGEDQTVNFPGGGSLKNVSVTIDYEGTTATGFVFTLAPTNLEVQGGFSLQSVSEYGTETFVYTQPILYYPPYVLDTRPGTRSILSDGASVLQGVEYGSDWIQLYPGQNTVTFTRIGGTVGSGNYNASITYPILESYV